MNRRTSFITAAAVTGVILAGTSAVSANVGILTAAGSDNVGELSAAVPITTVVEPQIIDVFLAAGEGLEGADVGRLAR